MLALTELGYKTANALMGRCLGSNVDGPPQPSATQIAEAVVNHEADASADEATGTLEATADAGTQDAAGESGADADAAAEPA